MAGRSNLKFSDIVNDINSAAGRVVVDPNNPTAEGQQAVQAWLDAHPDYDRNGANTSKYMKGYEPPQDTPPQDVPPVWNRALTPEEQYNMARVNAQVYGKPTYDPETVKQNQERIDQEQERIARERAIQNQKQATKPVGNIDDLRRKTETGLSKALEMWSPVMTNAVSQFTPFAGKDPTGAAAGMRTGSDISQKAAAEQSKIEQWNKQRATDETLADKIAAAQASSRWKQNANALGAEGGAAVVASQNEAMTPDIMSQKQYQSQSMGAAGQAMDKATAYKHESNNLATNANIEDYSNAYETTKNNEVANLAATKQTNESTEQKKPEQSTETTETTEQSTDNADNTNNTETTETTEQPAGPQAESNKQADKTRTASQITADKTRADQIMDSVKSLNNEWQNPTVTDESGNKVERKQFYDTLAKEYGDIRQRVFKESNVWLPALPPFNEGKNVSNIAGAINDITQ